MHLHSSWANSVHKRFNVLGWREGSTLNSDYEQRTAYTAGKSLLYSSKTKTILQVSSFWAVVTAKANDKEVPFPVLESC